MPAHVDHAVDRARPAEQPPARQEQAAPFSVGSGSVIIRQVSSGLSIAFIMPSGILTRKWSAPPPASSSSTRVFGSSVSRAARTQPADPAPTIT
jgi:hypothetical protein